MTSSSVRELIGWLLLLLLGGLWVLFTGGCTLMFVTPTFSSASNGAPIFLIIGAFCIAPGAALLWLGVHMIRSERRGRGMS